MQQLTATVIDIFTQCLTAISATTLLSSAQV